MSVEACVGSGVTPTACNLCPRYCGAQRAHGEVGVCRSGADMVVSRAALHFWEEPPISGEAGSGTIFFAGCNLRCNYCQNSAISREGMGEPASASEVAEMMLDLQQQGAMNVNLVTPTHFSDKVREAVALAKAQGLELPIVWNTSGYESVENIRANEGLVDVYLTDFKYCDPELARAYSGVPDYRCVAQDALDAMVASVGKPTFDDLNGIPRMIRGVVVRHMMLPGEMEDSKAVLRLLHERYGDSIRISIMNQYTPVLATTAASGNDWAAAQLAKYPQLANPVSHEEYEMLLDFADALGIEDYYWQDGETCAESFIPAFD